MSHLVSQTNLACLVPVNLIAKLSERAFITCMMRLDQTGFTVNYCGSMFSRGSNGGVAVQIFVTTNLAIYARQSETCLTLTGLVSLLWLRHLHKNTSSVPYFKHSKEKIF
jgi:hypothetical protein